jgi:hypothetical protein
MCEQIMIPLDGSALAGTSTATPPTDAEVARAVRTVLALNKAVPHERIRTRVSDRWVTLVGIVDLWSQREAAERAVRRIAGVRALRSAIAARAQRSTRKRDRSSTPRRWCSGLSVAAASCVSGAHLRSAFPAK